jgi:hypothetical protein
MEKHLKECITQILAGEVSAGAAQACLAHLTPGEFQRLLLEEGFQARFEAYKEDQQYRSTPLLSVSHREAATGWERITNTVPASAPRLHRLREWPYALGQDLYDLVSGAPLGRLGLVVVLLIAVLLPVMHTLQGPRRGVYLDEKGALAEAPASLQYALVGPSGKLLRPDRIITEADTLAFRIDTIRPGFVSIHIAHAKRLDPIITNHRLAKGTHDLDVGYTLSGNRGSNTLILLFAEAPIVFANTGQHRFLIEAIQNGVTSMTMEGNEIYMASQQIEVHSDRREEK